MLATTKIHGDGLYRLNTPLREGRVKVKDLKEKSVSFRFFHLLIIIVILSLPCGIAGATRALNSWHTALSMNRVSQSSTGAKRPVRAKATRSDIEVVNPELSRRAAVSSPVNDIAVMNALVAASGSNLYGPYSLIHTPGSSSVSRPTQTATNAPGDSLPPMLVTEADTARAIALESATCKAEPFTSTSLIPWAFGADHQTRISLFAMNIGAAFGDTNASTVTVDAEDSAQNSYPLAVEYLSEL